MGTAQLPGRPPPVGPTGGGGVAPGAGPLWRPQAWGVGHTACALRAGTGTLTGGMEFSSWAPCTASHCPPDLPLTWFSRQGHTTQARTLPALLSAARQAGQSCPCVPVSCLSDHLPAGPLGLCPSGPCVHWGLSCSVPLPQLCLCPRWVPRGPVTAGKGPAGKGSTCGVSQSWAVVVLVPALPLPSCVTVGK